MVNFTLRISNELNNELEHISNYANVSKSSLINLAIARYIASPEILETSQEKIRVTLRISETLNELLEIRLSQLSISKNMLINSLVKKFIDDFEYIAPTQLV
ncbi:hypothetical protein CG018_07695 [Gemella sp. ND 6198]|uniref:hypothetical protein n=1 Tax=Gemella sp. ND 6198 TaxID=2040624 RepID=UPI000E0B9C62|nr:hypothetical protein [Gemella sp. ND 6198]AXI27294.1 hypothetical protein CG018_07695 [Gemella sp. ND 6198]